MTRTVLLVDDNDQIREMLQNTLEFEEHDYKVYSASNGEEAIEILSENDDIDVVVLDVNMPVTDGWETLRVIRDPDNGWPNIEVIMLTVNQGAENALKAWDIGAAYYVPKPFALSRLLNVLENTFQKVEETL